MPASPISATVAKITDLDDINRLRGMLDDDGTLYDWSQDDVVMLRRALNCMAFMRSLRLKFNAWERQL